MSDDIRQQLAQAAAKRLRDAAELDASERREDELIAAAWREHVPPTEIARLVQRSTAHVRRLRPEDVPPARLGGNAAPKKRRRKA